MEAVESEERLGPSGDAPSPQPAGRAVTALHLIALSDQLQSFGYPYEAYQVREAAARLLREAVRP